MTICFAFVIETANWLRVPSSTLILKRPVRLGSSPQPCFVWWRETPGRAECSHQPYYLQPMSTKLTQQNRGGGVYFITFTCYGWKPLLELTNAYDTIYKWFDYLTDRGGGVIGYVIMPNHVHALIYLPPVFKSPNVVVSNAKRFIAYEIVKRLEAQGEKALLWELRSALTQRELKRGQLHRVFEESFDCKACYTPAFVKQKLDYIHYNPVRGKWQLADDFALYPHSSAGFYHGTGATVYKRLMRVEEVGDKAS